MYVMPSWQADLVGASQVNRDDLVPHLLVHVLEGFIPQNSRISDENVDSAESVDTGLHDGISIFRRANGSDCLSSSFSLTMSL